MYPQLLYDHSGLIFSEMPWVSVTENPYALENPKEAEIPAVLTI